MSTETQNTPAPTKTEATPTGEAKPFRSAALYVGDLHPEVTEAALFEIFNAVAPVASVRVCRHAITRQSLGYGYLNFHSVRDAERVLDTMNFSLIRGRMARLMWSQRDPSLRKSSVGNIFVKNLDPEIDSKDLYDTFSIFGNIISCKVVSDQQTGKSKGFGFVHFETAESAAEAIAKVNGNVISGRVVYVSNFQKRDNRAKNQEFTNLYVKNIPKSMSQEDLEKLAAPFGEVASCVLAKNDQGESKGFGYLDFKEHESAKKCIEGLHGKEFDHEVTPAEAKKLKKDDAEEKKEDENTKEEENQQEGDGKKTIIIKRKLFVARFIKRRERERIIEKEKAAAAQERIKEFVGRNLYVRNLSSTVTEDKLRTLFSEHGTVKSCKVMLGKDGNPRGFGFVCFSTREEANKALQSLNNIMFDGKPLYVALWQPKQDRQSFLQRQHMARGGRMGGPRGMMMPGMMPQMFARPPMFRGAPMGAPRPGFYNPMMMMARGPRPPMQNMPPQQQQQQQAPQQQGPPVLSAAALASASPEVRKNLIGERLYPLVASSEPALAGKVTGMLLDGMEVAELLHLIESPEMLQLKIREAIEVLESASEE